MTDREAPADENDLPDEDLVRMWEEGEPVEIVDQPATERRRETVREIRERLGIAPLPPEVGEQEISWLTGQSLGSEDMLAPPPDTATDTATIPVDGEQPGPPGACCWDQPFTTRHHRPTKANGD